MISAPEKILEQLDPDQQAIVKAIKAAKPDASKGKFIKEFFLSSTMGSSVQVAVESI